MNDWEIQAGDGTRGPLTEDAVIAEVRAGLPATTMVRPVGKDVWKPVGAHLPFAQALAEPRTERPTKIEWEVFDGKERKGPLSEEAVISDIHAGMNVSMVIRRVGDDEWKSLRTHAPFALVLDQASKRGTRRFNKPIALGGAGTLVVLSFLVVNTFWLGVGASIEPSCSVRGFGSASCFFTNRGFVPATRCVRLAMTNDQGAKMTSERMCTGVLWPQTSTNVEVQHAFRDSPVDHCEAGRGLASRGGKSWSDLCAMTVEQ